MRYLSRRACPRLEFTIEADPLEETRGTPVQVPHDDSSRRAAEVPLKQERDSWLLVVAVSVGNTIGLLLSSVVAFTNSFRP